MRDRESHRPQRQRRGERGADRRRIGLAVAARLHAGDAADLVIVDDQQIEMRQARPAEARDTSRGGRHHFEIGLEPAARAAASVAAQPVASPPQGASMRLVRAGQAEMQDAARVREKSKWSGDSRAATPGR